MTVPGADSTLVFICGSALRGQPDHANLAEAEFVGAAQTQPHYRLHAVKNGWHPGIYAVATGGIAIPGELYRLSAAQYEHLLATEPPDMYPATVKLVGGGEAIAILYPRELIERDNEPDISHYGGWATYKAAQAKVE
ncbi:MAG: gamma-glutamylcyclotransferase [Spirulinaceae cyanobacterium SM2_1_0]|nr:gamma-glutamylcyclotransferase [Spirulinaceae cyanobacterium SM2_1_0]